jgi:hypothetical protein
MKKFNLIWFILGVLIVLGFTWFLSYGNMSKAEAKACKSVNAECNVNDSNKLCCAGLVCMDKGVPSDTGKCQIQPTATPTLTPKPTATPTPTPKPPKDYCKNFEKDQKEIPYGMESIEGICDCTEGYHRVEEQTEEVLTLRKPEKEWDTFICEKDEEPEPEPEPEPQPEPAKPSGCTGDCSAPAPQCGSPNTTNQPINFHVYRNGEDAILKWWATEGNKVNVYWKNPSNANWEHAAQFENTGYVEIHNLGTYDWTFGIQQVNDCGGGLVTVGKILEVVDGNMHGWVLFR